MEPISTIGAMVALLILVVMLLVLIKGGIQTFHRNWFIALILLLAFTPLWVCWAIVEAFLPKPKPQELVVHVVNHNN